MEAWAPSRCKFFMWLLLQNRVCTTDCLLQRQWPKSYLYQLCYRSLETAQHLFKECTVTSSVWRSINSLSGRTSLHPDVWNMNTVLVDLFQELAGRATSTTTKGIRSIVILVVWTICERNARIFNHQEKPIAKIIDNIKDASLPWGVAGAKDLASLVDRTARE